MAIQIAKRLSWLMAARTGASASLQTLLVRISILFVNVATGMITARALGEVGRGEQAAMMLWPSLLASMLSFGLPSALLYRSKQNMQQRERLISASLILSLIYGGLAIIIGWFAIPYWMGAYSEQAILFSRLLVLMAPVSILSSSLQASFQAEGCFSVYNRNTYAIPLCTLLALIALLATRQLSPFTSSLAYALPGLPVVGLMLHRTFRSMQFVWPSWNLSILPLLTCGVRYYGMEIFGRVSLEVDKILVIGMLSPSQMGYYSVVLSLSRMLTIFHASLSSVLLPKVTARDTEDVVHLTGIMTRLCIVLTGTVALIVSLLGGTVLNILYGASFVPAVNTLRVLLLEVILGSAAWMLAQTFLALGKPTVVTLFQVIGFSLSVPLMMVLIPRYGILGASLSLTASTVVRLCFIQLSFIAVLGVRPPVLLPNSADVKYLRQAIAHR